MANQITYPNKITGGKVYATEINEIKSTVNTNADELDLATTKLTGIEAGSEVNQTDLEIKTQYENNLDTNAFLDAEKVKLGNLTDNFKGIFADATARDSAVPTPINGNYVIQDDTSSVWYYNGATWVDTEASSIGDMLQSVYDPTNKASDSFNQDNMSSGTVNKNFTATEQTKLIGIEEAAEVNPTDPETKTAYENNADTNAYTDAEKTKVGVIATNGSGNNYLADDGTYKAIDTSGGGEEKPTLIERTRTGVTEVVDMELNQTTQINFATETAIDIQITPPIDTATKQTTRRVILNNIDNPNTVSSITFNDNSGAVDYIFGDGDPINSLAIGATAIIELSNIGSSVIYIETKSAQIV